MALFATSAFKLVTLLAASALSFKSATLRTSLTHAIKFATFVAFYALAFKSFGIAPRTSFALARFYHTAFRTFFTLTIYFIASLTLVTFASVMEASLAPSFAIFFALYSNSAAAVMCYKTAALPNCSVSFVALSAFLRFFFPHAVVLADMVRFVIVTTTAATFFNCMTVERLISNVNNSVRTVMAAIVAMT